MPTFAANSAAICDDVTSCTGATSRFALLRRELEHHVTSRCASPTIVTATLISAVITVDTRRMRFGTQNIRNWNGDACCQRTSAATP
jgi:hypothetical protein